MPNTRESEPISRKSSRPSATAISIARIPGLSKTLKLGVFVGAPAAAVAGAMYLSRGTEADAAQTAEPAMVSSLDANHLDQSFTDHWQSIGSRINELRASGQLNPIKQIELTQVQLSSNLSVDQ